ncbi:MAG: hypothetical protein ACI9JN_001907 [Bacteroidia bacterium]|jgi:hypothetical protein
MNNKNKFNGEQRAVIKDEILNLYATEVFKQGEYSEDGGFDYDIVTYLLQEMCKDGHLDCPKMGKTTKSSTLREELPRLTPKGKDFIMNQGGYVAQYRRERKSQWWDSTKSALLFATTLFTIGLTALGINLSDKNNHLQSKANEIQIQSLGASDDIKRLEDKIEMLKLEIINDRVRDTKN